MPVERLSIELTNRCAKSCAFCYNASGPRGETLWTADEVVTFAEDAARAGTRAVSLGGGEPLQHDGVFEILARLEGTLFRSVTTNGLLLDGPLGDALIAARPDKVHVSIHFAEREAEVARVIRQVTALEERGVHGGINLLVPRSGLDAARATAERLWAAGISNERIVYLPQRGRDTPTPEEMGRVAGGLRFQSMSCLMGCGRSPRFAAVAWDRTVAWCSYTTERRPLRALTAQALDEALDGLGLVFCGGTDDA